MKYRKAGVICTPIYDVRQVFEDPHVQHRGMRIEVEHPIAGSLPILRNPIRFSETPLDTYRAPPTLFAHSEELRQEGTGRSIAAAVATGHQALARFRELGERGRQADVLYSLAYACRTLGLTQ